MAFFEASVTRDGLAKIELDIVGGDLRRVRMTNNSARWYICRIYNPTTTVLQRVAAAPASGATTTSVPVALRVNFPIIGTPPDFGIDGCWVQANYLPAGMTAVASGV